MSHLNFCKLFWLKYKSFVIFQNSWSGQYLKTFKELNIKPSVRCLNNRNYLKVKKKGKKLIFNVFLDKSFLQLTKTENTHDMSIDKLQQSSISNDGLMHFCSPIRMENFLRLLGVWTFKWIGEPLVGDYGFAVL